MADEPPVGRTWRAHQVALVTIAVVCLIAFAKWAADFIVPVVAGILLAYAVEPLVGRLIRVHVPRGIATTLVLATLVGGLSWTVYSLRNDAADALAELPEAARRLRETIRISSANGSTSPLAHVQKAAAELDKAAAEASGAPPSGRAPAPAAAVSNELSKQLATHSAALLGVFAQILIAVTLAFF